MKILFKGGFVISGNGAKRADVLVEGEKVVKLERHITCAEAKVVDATGKLLFPGWIDGQTHFTTEQFAVQSQAAIRGGTTTVLDVLSESETVEERRGAVEGNAYCDYGFHQPLNKRYSLQQLTAMFATGVSTFTIDMSQNLLSDGELLELLSMLKSLGGLCCVHCENGSVLATLVARRQKSGNVKPAAYPLARPEILEIEAVSRLLRLAQLAEAPVLITNVSTAATLQEVEVARKRKQLVYLETAPHYLLLDDSAYFQAERGGRYLCTPPLRKTQDQEKLWKSLRGEQLQCIASHHISVSMEEKSGQDFTQIPMGFAGVGFRGELLYTKGVAEGRISLGDMCRLLSEQPAKLYGLFPRKGVLQEGSDADIVLYDPKAGHILPQDDTVGYHPYAGLKTVGRVEQVWLRGQLVVHQGNLQTESTGRYLLRSRSRLEW